MKLTRRGLLSTLMGGIASTLLPSPPVTVTVSNVNRLMLGQQVDFVGPSLAQLLQIEVDSIPVHRRDHINPSKRMRITRIDRVTKEVTFG